jgi:hypothetical protein
MGFSRAAFSTFAVLVTLIWASHASAQTQRLRGVVESVDGNALTVKTHDGKDVKVLLDDNYTVSHAVSATLADLTPGTFIGVGAVPDGDGLKAAQVQIFGPNTNASERHGAWSSDPSGTMTNAPVTAVVASQNGGMLTLTAQGQAHDIKVGPDAPIIRTEAGTKDLVKRGAWIGISNGVEKDGVLMAKSIVVSDDRRYPAR